MDREEHSNSGIESNYAKGDNNAITQLYDAYFGEFYRWCWKHQIKLTDDEINGIYTDAIMIFRDKAWSGELENYHSCSDKTILFSIAKKLIQKQFSSKKNSQEKIDKFLNTYGEDQQISEEIDRSLQEISLEKDNNWPSLDLSEHKKLQAIFAELSEKCKNIFMYCFAYELPTHEVVAKLAYNSEDSLKTQKYKCMKKVKSLIGQNQEK